MRAPAYPNEEARVVRAFTAYLQAEGWSVVLSRASVNEPDVVATRGSERLVAEAKGRTAAPRTDIDTMFGQLLRRVDLDSNTRFAAVLPSAFVLRALEVRADVRHLLRIDVFEVADDGLVVQR